MKDTIHKRKLPLFNFEATSPPILTKKSIVSVKDVTAAQKLMDIAKERGMATHDILSHDLFDSTPIFDGDLPSKADKSDILEHLESEMIQTASLEHSDLKTHLIVDFMSKVRQMNMSNHKLFGDLIKQFISVVSKVCSHEMLHVIFYSYLESSVKDGERLRRSDVTPIELVELDGATPIPVSLNKFWASSSNKEKLQLLVRELLKKSPNSICSAMVVDDDILPSMLHDISGNSIVIPELDSRIEEADARTVPHIFWAAQKGCERAIILSNDTDTVALLLYHMGTFLNAGLKELWIQVGTGGKRRFLALHDFFHKKGAIMCKAVLKAHILTGEDCMSKIGTKLASVKYEPARYLINFAEDISLNEQDVLLAEEYLVKVWTGVLSKTSALSFDQLRIEFYNTVSLNMLPPTSAVMRGHILRGFYLIRKAVSLLDDDPIEMNPVDFGWNGETGILLPSKFLKPLPNVLRTTCKCTSDCAKRCKCKAANLKCVVFCHNKINKGLKCTNTSGNYDAELFEYVE